MRSSHRIARAGALLALLAAGCTSGNPGRPGDSRWRAGEGPTEEPAKPADAPAEEAAPDAAPEGSAESAAAAFGLQEAGAVPIVARVSEESIDVSDLLDAWMHVNSRELIDVVERLVSAKLVEIEARRTGITLTPEQIEEAYQKQLAELEAEFARTNPGSNLDDWISGALGMEPEHYRAGLRRDVERQILAPRVVRAFILGNERRNARILVTETRADIEAALAEYRAGRDFGELVEERSVEPNKKDGGRIPPVLRSQSSLARLVFMTAVGDVGGPIQDTQEGRWMILAVDSEEPAIVGPWPEIAARVEASLAVSGIVDPEYWQWKVEMSRRHEVDLDPLFELMQASP